MKKFAAKVDLSDFFDDERKLVLILIDNTWRNVECLQHKLQAMFAIDEVRLVTSEGYFVPPQEEIEVVKFVDILKAFRHAESLTKKQIQSNKLKRKRAAEQPSQERAENGVEFKQFAITEEHLSLESSEKQNKIKRKFFSVENGFSSSTPNQAKRSKNMREDPVSLPKICNKSNEISSSTAINEFITTTNKEKPHSPNKQVNSNDCENLENQKSCSNKKQNSSNRNNTSNNHGMESLQRESEKSGRKSCVFRKPSNKTCDFVDKSIIQQNKKNGNSTRKTSCTKNLEKSQHIYYNESGEAVSTTTESDGTMTQSKNYSDVENASTNDINKIIFRCSLEEISINKPRLFQIKQTKTPIKISENILLVTSKMNECLAEDKKIAEEVEHSLMECESMKATALNDEQNGTGHMTHLILEPSEKTEGSVMACESLNVTELNDEQYKTQHVTLEALKVSEKSEESLIADESFNVAELKDAQDETDHLTSLETENNAEITETSNSIELDIERDHSQIKTKDNVAHKSATEEIEDREESNVINLDEDDVEEVSSIIDLSETEEVDITNDNTSASTSSKVSTLKNTSDGNDMNISEMMPFSTELKALPVINDIVLFKMISVSGRRYTTKYMAGKCEYINKRTKNIKLLLIGGKSEIQLIPLKYIVNLDESSQELLYLNIKFDDMIEPKLVQI